MYIRRSATLNFHDGKDRNSMITYCCMHGSENFAGFFNLYDINLLLGAGKS